MCPDRPSPESHDRPPREAAARLIEQLRDGEIHNDVFENDYLDLPQDGVVGEAFMDAWGCYCDFRTYKLTGTDTLPPNAAAMLTRWVLFLRSDLEYEWPPRPTSVPTMSGAVMGSLAVGIAAAGMVGWIAIAITDAGWVLIIAMAIGIAGGVAAMVSMLSAAARGPRIRNRWLEFGNHRVYPFRTLADFEAWGGNPVLMGIFCPQCGYDLAGQMEPGCPECGWRRTGQRDGPVT